MPALFIYLIKVNVALLIFCAGYYAVLRHLTFYNLNRVYLITAIIFSTLYPLLDVAAFLNRHEELAKPVQVVVINWQQPVKEITKTFLGRDVWFWMLAAFWAGVTLFGVRLGMQLLSLYRLHKRSQPLQIQQYMIRVIDGDINPFSFWQNIYINPKNHPERELGAILEHEQIHVKEWHTLDILLGELSAIFYWFNPGVWLMKRAIRENIEFITDQKILMKGVDRKDYQYSLLNVNMGAENSAIVNNFNMSTIKKRIMMMNAKRSSKVNITRYLFLVPAVVVLLLIFSVSKAEVKKVAKNSEKIMQAITIKLKDMVTIDEPVKTETKQATKKKRQVQTLEVALSDSMEVSPMRKFFHIDFVTKVDTDRRPSVNITRLYRGISLDSNNKITKMRVNGQEVPEVFIDGVKSEMARLAEIIPDHITDVKVFSGEMATKGQVHVITNRLPGVSVSPLYRGDSLIHKTKVQGIQIQTSGSTGRLRGYPVPADGSGKIVTADGDTVYATNVSFTRAISAEPDLKEVTVKGFSAHATPAKVLNIKATSTSFNFNDKLVIIDGKESKATDIKDLGIDHIDTIGNMPGSEGVKKYGDKAKNGVVFIKTK
ncbi:M56 family metallopeptidase [Mucilaginibacter myungsuensis]|uniref:M56 family metallopeptidase n=1 Tax=Mucilaginibacter myungsuensis TaxID=649104 RepID=A0A929KTT9_9SPHI|nr:M56 family metallopeptidase [Mucilaginibacter myungsuensis]MBE9660310.1 M56 family metallopeptidase [Mucilaginibacter myungsuensis]MDN3600352.1 M56 family metallopeptidase [Mucilaginibacter myungsuensis]